MHCFKPVIHYILFIVLGKVGASLFSSESSTQVVHDERYQRGKAQYEAWKAESRMPKYSKCWTDALELLSVGCKNLNDDVQHRLALAFTNCFLLKTGRNGYSCDRDDEISTCVKPMTAEAYNTYTEFFTHSQNICFFLQSQVWQAETQRTVTRLSENSAQVAQQMEDSSHLQKEILQKQNDSLTNQDMLLARGKELKGALEHSTVDVQIMMKEFKMATAEQKASIMDVFDRIQSLQSLVMGEFTGFYSMVFYTTSLIVSYLLTSTPRTGGARFWLFFVMTLNVVAERLIVSLGASDFVTDTGQIISSSEVVYGRLSICRKVSSVFGILVLLIISMMYEDINKVNHQLLQTITEQNYQIKHLLQSSAVSPGNGIGHTPDADRHTSQTVKSGYDSTSDQVDSAIGYESDSESFDSGTTDHTYKADEIDSDSEAESFLTSTSSRRSRTGTPTLLDELRDLREGTPVHGVTDLPADFSTVIFDSSTVSNDARTSTPQKRRGRPPGRRTPLNISEVPSPQTRYNLRARQQTPSINPHIHSESEKDFGRVVQHLARVSARNSLKTKYTLGRLRPTQNGDYSTDDY